MLSFTQSLSQGNCALHTLVTELQQANKQNPSPIYLTDSTTVTDYKLKEDEEDEK